MHQEARHREQERETSFWLVEDYNLSRTDRRPTILVVEDYPDAREMMRLMLDILGYRVLEAENGAQAVEVAVQRQPDLVLMDINLPVLDGFQASAQIRQQPGVANVPIIACTAGNQNEWRTRALAVGCNDFLSKPLNFDDLENILAHYLGGKGTEH